MEEAKQLHPAVQEAHTALTALYLAVESPIADDVKRTVLKAFDALQEGNFTTDKEVSEEIRNLSHIKNLTDLQHELGYGVGGISTIALLGLAGEAGEVLAETGSYPNPVFDEIKPTLVAYTEIAKTVDGHKKTIRRTGIGTGILRIKPGNEEEFDKELADVAYYLNILATNRGLTLGDLCQMAHDKVREKQRNGGSSEDPKTWGR